MAVMPDFNRAPDSDGRYRGLIHFLGFIVIVFFGAMVIGIGVMLGFGMHHPKTGALFAKYSYILEPVSAAIALIATFIMARASKRSFFEFGYGGTNRIRNFVIGLVVGIGTMALLLGMMNYAGAVTLGGITLDESAAVHYGLLYGFVFLCVGINEESTFRGFGLVSLTRVISFWPATIALALMFGAAHAGNPGETIYGLVDVFVFAIIMAVSFRATGSLWYAVGVHFGWEYAESFLFGVPDSGLTLPGTLMHPVFHGPAWLTGGSVGPEGSALVFIPELITLVLIWFIRAPKAAA